MPEQNLVFLTISFNTTGPAQVGNLVQPILAGHTGFVYSQQQTEIRAAFLDLTSALACLAALEKANQSEKWQQMGLSLSLKMAFDLGPGQSAMLAEAALSAVDETLETNNWLLGRLLSQRRPGKQVGSPVDWHWYALFHGMYRPGLDWLNKQLNNDQTSNNHLLNCVISLLKWRSGGLSLSSDFPKGILSGISDFGDMWTGYLVRLTYSKINSGSDAPAVNGLWHEFRAGKQQAALLANLGKAARFQGSLEAAAILFQRSLEISRQTGDKPAEIIALCNLADSYQALRDYPRMAELFEQALERLREFNREPNSASLLAVMAFLLAEPGDTRLAAELLAESKRLGQLLGSDNVAFNNLVATAENALEMLPPEKLLGHYQKSLGLAWHGLDPYGFAFALLGQAQIKLDQDLLNQAKPYLKRSFGVGVQSRNWPVVVHTLEALARFWLRQGQDKRATRLFNVAARLREMFGIKVSHLKQAAHNENLSLLEHRLGHRIFKQTWARGNNLSPQEALKIGLGATPKLKSAPRPAPARAAAITTEEPASPAPLSQRELEVLYLVAMGLTNPQIARQMTLSTYTVSSYLRSIYNKLGVTTRTAAASYAFKNLYKLP